MHQPKKPWKVHKVTEQRYFVCSTLCANTWYAFLVCSSVYALSCVHYHVHYRVHCRVYYPVHYPVCVRGGLMQVATIVSRITNARWCTRCNARGCNAMHKRQCTAQNAQNANIRIRSLHSTLHCTPTDPKGAKIRAHQKNYKPTDWLETMWMKCVE